MLLFITGRMGRCTRVGVPAKISGDEEQREGTTGLDDHHYSKIHAKKS